MACVGEGFQFLQCRAADADGLCVANMCSPVDLESILQTYPEAVKSEVLMASAFVTPDNPEFCGYVEEGMCSNYEADTCCCSTEMLAWQKCLLNSDPVSKPCTVDCPALALAQQSVGGGGEGGSEGGGGSMMIVVVLVVLALAGGGGFFLYRRKRMANGKVVGDGDDDNQNKPEKGGCFSGFRSKSNGVVTPPGSDIEDRDGRNRKSRNSRRSNNKSRNHREFPDDIEQGGLLSDVSLLEDDTSRFSRTSGDRKRYDDDDEESFANNNNKYGESKKNGNPRGSRRSYDDDNDRRQRSKYNPSSNMEKFEDEDDNVSDLDPGDLEHPTSRNSGRVRNSTTRSYRSASSKDDVLPPNIQSSRKISSRDLKNILKDQAESSHRLSSMEDEVMTLEDRLSRKDRQAAELRQEHEDQRRRIQELEVLNARLTEQNSRPSASSTSHRSSSHSRQTNNHQGQVSRSKASMGDENYSEHSIPRSRSGVALDSDHSSYGNRSRRQRSRSGSGRSLGRSGPSRPKSHSPSSSRGLGKQSSAMRRRETSRERDSNIGKPSSSKQRREISPKRESRGKSSNRRLGRSKSPRTYL